MLQSEPDLRPSATVLLEEFSQNFESTEPRPGVVFDISAMGSAMLSRELPEIPIESAGPTANAPSELPEEVSSEAGVTQREEAMPPINTNTTRRVRTNILSSLQLDGTKLFKRANTPVVQHGQITSPMTISLIAWLPPSHELVEAQLRVVRRRKGVNTLGWVNKMTQFAVWHSQTKDEAIHQPSTLWIKGAAGVGKSTLAGR